MENVYKILSRYSLPIPFQGMLPELVEELNDRFPDFEDGVEIWEWLAGRGKGRNISENFEYYDGRGWVYEPPGANYEERN